MRRVPGGCSTDSSVPVSARAIARAHKAHALGQWLTRGRPPGHPKEKHHYSRLQVKQLRATCPSSLAQVKTQAYMRDVPGPRHSITLPSCLGGSEAGRGPGLCAEGRGQQGAPRPQDQELPTCGARPAAHV